MGLSEIFPCSHCQINGEDCDSTTGSPDMSSTQMTTVASIEIPTTNNTNCLTVPSVDSFPISEAYSLATHALPEPLDASTDSLKSKTNSNLEMKRKTLRRQHNFELVSEEIEMTELGNINRDGDNQHAEADIVTESQIQGHHEEDFNYQSSPQPISLKEDYRGNSQISHSQSTASIAEEISNIFKAVEAKRRIKNTAQRRLEFAQSVRNARDLAGSEFWYDMSCPCSTSYNSSVENDSPHAHSLHNFQSSFDLSHKPYVSCQTCEYKKRKQLHRYLHHKNMHHGTCSCKEHRHYRHHHHDRHGNSSSASVTNSVPSRRRHRRETKLSNNSVGSYQSTMSCYSINSSNSPGINPYVYQPPAIESVGQNLEYHQSASRRERYSSSGRSVSLTDFNSSRLVLLSEYCF